jgi:hypothetical protein
MTRELESMPIGPTAMLNPQWWAWNEDVWGVRALELDLNDGRPSGDSIRGALYQDRRGRIITPPLNPHLPIAFISSAAQTQRLDTRSRVWLELGGRLAEILSDRGLGADVILPPEATDARPFTWRGLRAQFSYTYLGTLPRDLSLANPSVAQKIRKASSRGYVAERSDDWVAILSCLTETEVSKGFSHRLTLSGLRLGARLMGPECFRGYVVRDTAGRVVSGGVRLHSPGHRALDWVQGTLRHALKDGVNQLMYDFVMRDLEVAGAAGFDFAGANIEPVAAAKSSWGYPLIPQIKLDSPGVGREVRNSLIRMPTVRRAVLQARQVVQMPGGRGEVQGPEVER